MMLYSKTDEEVELIVACLRAAAKKNDRLSHRHVLNQFADRIEKERKDQRQDLTDYADEIQQARDQYALSSDDDLEIDDEPILSKGDDGLWVNAWVWVSAKDPDEEDE